ncbi:hypothetical protein SAMN05660413_03331 [Salegentibacter flavus]|uniref:Uncharacterized protein n=1 Tax=Salegentibacter flavus TaxID=287099 RepID=A0A1I5DGL0_9FLAO|nr:hypothetical protein SAMN05660413_03331 [Salegentibacter flavus]
MVMMLIEGMMNTTGTTFTPFMAIAIIFAVNAVMSIDKKII